MSLHPIEVVTTCITGKAGFCGSGLGESVNTHFGVAGSWESRANWCQYTRFNKQG